MANGNNKNNKTLGDIASTLKNAIVGTKTTQIDQKLDSAVKDITSFRSNINQQNYIELLRYYISQSQKNGGVNASLFSQHGDSSPSALGQGQRLKRYKLYNSIVSNITYCKRALTVLVDNILAPDDITKESIEVKPESYLEDQEQTESRIKQVRTIVNKLKLESNLNLIVKNTLLYGDYFCEIADDKTALTSRSFLVESELLTNSYNNENRSKAYQGNGITVNINYDYLYEKKGNKNKNKSKKDDDVYDASQLNIVLHNPDRVVKLQSDLYPICFGYLIFPRYSGHGSFGSYREEQPIDDICAGILRDLQKQIPQASELQNDEEIKDIINTMISQTNTNVMNIRYVPPNRMTHFNVPSSKYYPYGESIFDSVQFDAKVLMAMQTALAVQRINKSTEKRKIGIELGLPRDASKQIQELKETFRKRKVTLDNYETIDSIPCLDLNTKIPIVGKDSLTLSDIIDKYNKGESNIYVHSYDFNTGRVFPNKVIGAQVSGRNVEVVKVVLNNDMEIICTPDHRWLMNDNTYKEAKDLNPNDNILSRYNNKIKYIESLNYGIDVGDIQVEKHHNFALESGVFVHNSSINTFEDIYIPQKDGTPYVDIENMDDGTVDTRSKVDELKFLRDSIIAALDVPPAFLGIEENLCIPLDSLIKLVDDRELTLNQIIEEYNQGIENEVYSYDHETGMIVPGKITWAGETRKNAQLVRVHLDNGEYEDCTPDHPWMFRDGTYKEAKDLEPNDSLMSLDLEEKIIVDEVENINNNKDTGDITVEGYHNFALKSGVIVHNSQRNTLSEENSLFARAVVSHQKYLSDQIADLIYKVYYLTNPEDAFTLFDNVSIALPAPRNLAFERQSKALNDAINVVEALERIDVPKEWAKKKFLTNIDWDEVESYEIDSEIDKKLGEEEEDEEEGGGGFGM